MNILAVGGEPWLVGALGRAADRRGHGCTEVDGHQLPASGSFDLCVDLSLPTAAALAERSARLGERVGHYALLSSATVYGCCPSTGLHEDSPLQALGRTWAARAADLGFFRADPEAEVALERARPHGHTILRAGLTIDPADPANPLARWSARFARGGEVLAPAPAGARVQWLHGEDLMDFVLSSAERGARGTYNVAGPAEPACLGSLLAGLLDARGGDGSIQFVDEGFLEEQGLLPGVDLPFWIPEHGPRGWFTLDTDRARGAGLTCRSLSDTLSELTRVPCRSAADSDGDWLGGRSERELLRRWRALARPHPVVAGREL